MLPSAGRLPTIGRNVFNAIFAFDPASQAALDIGLAAARAHADGWPLRLGLLPVAPGAVRRAPGGEGVADLRLQLPELQARTRRGPARTLLSLLHVPPSSQLLPLSLRAACPHR